MAEKIYRIFHNYDRGDQSVYLASANDPTEAAVYCQLIAEEVIGDSVSVLNSGIAQALIQLYGCTPAVKSKTAIDVDMYYARERLCGFWGRLKSDKSLHREGIIEILRPHTE